MVLHRVQDLLTHPHHGIERVHRALGNQRHGGEPKLSHLFVRQLQQADALQRHRAALILARRADEAHQGQRYGRLD